MAPARVQKVIFDALHDANAIDDTKDIEKLTMDDDEDGSFSVSYKIHYSDEVHEVSGLETLEDCALDRDHTRVKCSCALGRNGQVCPPKMKAMLKENNFWTFKAFNIQCKPDDVGTDADLPMTQDDDHVEVSQPAHRRSLGANYDMKGTMAKFAQGLNACMQFALDPQFTCEPAEGAHLLDSISKLEHFLNNLQTHREMSRCISRNSKTEDGAVGMSSLQNLPVRGAKGDTKLRRKRDFVEKFVDERKGKERKGKQQSILGFLS